MIGSSPLARGTLVFDDVHQPGGRIIPARAGNTPRPRKARSSTSDHPRSRGEHVITMDRSRADRGSSPLARGTHGAGRGQALRDRIIPARAGNTPPSAIPRSGPLDHPRSRGEHRTNPTAAKMISGSSPLARGTRFDPQHIGPGSRIIPARAGNTHRPNKLRFGEEHHPRSRGEHTPWHWTCCACSGSSPLARGTPRSRARPRCRSRIIPARAGNTGRGKNHLRSDADHPRSRGEHAAKAGGGAAETGSSPLARGTRHGHRFPCLR